MARCKRCGDKIAWSTVATSGKKIPLDPTPIHYGERMVTGNSMWAVLDGKAHYVQPYGRAVGMGLFRCHFASCPAVDPWERLYGPAKPAPTGDALWLAMAELVVACNAQVRLPPGWADWE